MSQPIIEVSYHNSVNELTNTFVTEGDVATIAKAYEDRLRAEGFTLILNPISNKHEGLIQHHSFTAQSAKQTLFVSIRLRQIHNSELLLDWVIENDVI